MLDIKQDIDFPAYKWLVSEFRRGQVSRFPIDLIVNDGGIMLGFVDSRFPTDRFSVDKMLAMIYVKEDGENPTLTLESRLIQNNKYSMHNDDYHTKSTKDLQKMLKFMKEYIKPYSGQEIAQKTYRSVEQDWETWRNKPWRNLRNAMSELDTDDYIKEFLALAQIGIEPQTKEFREAMSIVIPESIESKRRKSKPFDAVHIHINPDESICLTIMKGEEKGSKIVESVDECPQYVQQALAMLKMVDDNTHIPEVGKRNNEKDFWVEGSQIPSGSQD
jgi:hypothetical protein